MAVEQLTYTDVERGKGFNPNRAGFQIKACSPGMDDDVRLRLEAICMHYGDAVYKNVPLSAQKREDNWRLQSTEVSAVPPEVLNEFPAIWSYDHLRDNLYALTRFTYTGRTYDGRFGNFFAHALVFAVEDLLPHRSNPLALMHTSLTKPKSANDGASLGSLANLGSSTRDAAVFQALRTSPFKEHAAGMLSALSTATPYLRPVVICIADWRQACLLVEGLIELLPPTARARITCCTNESDHQWIPQMPGPRQSGQVTAHHLAVLCSRDGSPIQLRPDEYQSRLAAFNFTANQFSPLEAPRPYAAFAVRCLEKNHIDQLDAYHKLLEGLQLGQDAGAWDALLPAVGLFQHGADPEVLSAAVNVFVQRATKREQAGAALKEILPHVERFARSGDASRLAALCENLPALIQRAPNEAGPRIQAWAAVAFAEGRGRVAKVLVDACGGRKETVLTVANGVLNDRQASFNKSDDRDDRTCVVEVLVQAVAAAQESPGGAPSLDALLLVTFAAASRAGNVGDVWRQLGGSCVMSRLVDPVDAGKLAFIADIEKFVTPDACPIGSVSLNLKMLRIPQLRDEEAAERLMKVAAALVGVADPESLAEELHVAAKRRFRKPQELALVLGRMADRAGSGAAGEQLFAAYADTLTGLSREDQVAVRRKMAEKGAGLVLGREIAEELLPWHPEQSPRRLAEWRRGLLDASPAVADGLCTWVAQAIRSSADEAEEVLPLAQALLEEGQKRKASSSGFLSLFNAAARALPLRPFKPEWRRVLSQLPEGLDPDASKRFRIMSFLTEIDRSSHDGAWAPPMFPCDARAWRDDVASLDLREKEKVAHWCVRGFMNVGVVSADHAQALARMLDAIGLTSVEDVVGCIRRLLHERDPVTRVIVVTAFAQCALDAVPPTVSWERVVGSLAEGFDKQLRALLVRHLQQRFYRRNESYEKRLRRFAVDAGLPELVQEAPPAPRHHAEAEAAPETESPAKTPATRSGILKWFGKK